MGIHKHSSKARICLTRNNEGDCIATDSRIAFGTGGLYGNSNACRNEAVYGGDNGEKHIKGMGYISVH